MSWLQIALLSGLFLAGLAFSVKWMHDWVARHFDPDAMRERLMTQPGEEQSGRKS